jgi:NADPH-dependent 2,4-dienoyl-CoA reductase/sulfur reductase-like enzyme
MPERLIVIGGDAAGMSAASQARRRRGPDDLEIIAFERGDYTSYSACGIPYFVADTVTELDKLITRKPEVFREKQNIEVRIRTEVTAIDLEKRQVEARAEDGTTTIEGFDQLMIATGGSPLRPPLPGIDAAGIFGVQTLNDGVLVRQVVEDEKPKHAVVVGGGYIGLEMAEAFVARGMEVALVEAGPQPMKTLDPDMGELIADAMRGMGIQVFTGERVSEFQKNDAGHVTGVATDQRTLHADIVVLGLGTRPNATLAKDAGVSIGPSGGVVVDQQMRTPHEGVWSAGDCAEKFHRVSRQPIAIALGTHANKEGRVAGINIGGGYATFPGVVGTAVSKVCDLEVARTGLTEKEAEKSGFDYLAATVDSTTRAGYFPGAAPIRTKLIVETRSGRLLGAQIVGKEGAAKRIDALATALWNEMTVDHMLNMDLSYAPPFAPVWDPVLIAARKAWEKVESALSDVR